MRGDIRPLNNNQADECDSCGAPATCRMQGETDSFGCEWLHLCAGCADRIKREEQQQLQATEVPDREGSFLVSGCFNVDDGSPGWCRAFTSFREATAFLRQQRRLAEHRAGIYPRSSDCVQERADAAECEQRFDAAEAAEALAEADYDDY